MCLDAVKFASAVKGESELKHKRDALITERRILLLNSLSETAD